MVEVDMYNAGSALGLADDELARAALDDVLRGCLGDRVPRDVVVEDFSVLRFAGGVTKFAPGTASAAVSDAGGVRGPRGIRGGGLDVAGTGIARREGLSQGEGARVGVRRRRRRREMDRDGDEKKTGVGAPAKIRNVERDEDHVAAARRWFARRMPRRETIPIVTPEAAVPVPPNLLTENPPNRGVDHPR